MEEDLFTLSVPMQIDLHLHVSQEFHL